MWFSFIVILLSSFSSANPLILNTLERRTETGSGCTFCTPGPWTTSVACNSYEYFAVASSMKNPPDTITFNATSFCSEFLRPLITQLSVVTVTSPITTSTSVDISLVYLTPLATKTSPILTATASYSQSAAMTTASPESNPALAVKKRNFTVPEYLEPWYFYGRLDPGCSCIITSASPSMLVSATETSTLYEYTVLYHYNREGHKTATRYWN
ncbi:hypothetical protein VTL71DRAFT_7161 [Oculimacula yallundae]|uniref:Uncharacterized protein n=1 Tax=Oculimacula yallundae TaxID=86028 RepID=A0ABR4BVW9_9HELO